MTTRPIAFTAPMVRALLAGTKTQTRRLVKGDVGPCPYAPGKSQLNGQVVEENPAVLGQCRVGQPGDRLWVRETARVLEVRFVTEGGLCERHVRVRYEADGTESDWLPFPKRLVFPGVGRCIANGVHREGARLHYEVTEVRVQRFSEISEEDAKAEGVALLAHIGHDQRLTTGERHGDAPSRFAFALLVESIYGPDAWNQWCWAVTFRRVP